MSRQSTRRFKLSAGIDERRGKIFGLVKNHGFIDGTRRLARTVYLKIYGVKLNCSQAERVAVTMNVAASQMSREEFLHVN